MLKKLFPLKNGQFERKSFINRVTRQVGPYSYHWGRRGRCLVWFPGKKEKRDHDSFNIFQKSKWQVFKLAIFQVVSPLEGGGCWIQELFPEFGFVNLDPAGSVLLSLFWICSDVVVWRCFTSTVMILSGSLILKLFSKDGIRVAIGNSILQSPTVIWNCSLNYYFKYQSVILCLIYHRSFGDVVAIYDSNWYIKRLSNIEIDKNKMRYFGPLSHNFRPRERGCLARMDPPYIGGPHDTASPVLNPYIRPWQV